MDWERHKRNYVRMSLRNQSVTEEDLSAEDFLLYYLPDVGECEWFTDDSDALTAELRAMYRKKKG